MVPESGRTFVPALAYRGLTRFYDLAFGLMMPEAEMRSVLARRATAAGPRRILDVGCGTGTLTFRIAAELPEAEVVGLDPDPEVLAMAERKRDRSKGKVRFVGGSADSLPFPDGSFEAVVTSMVFHHLPPEVKRDALAEACRVLAPGGRFLLMDFGRPKGAWARTVFPLVRGFDGFAGTYDNMAGRLPTLMSDAGFQDVSEDWSRGCLFGTLYLHEGRRP